MIEVRKITKSFDDIPVLKSLSFTVQEAEKIALIGPSGCGKTTLLRILLGLIEADSGSVEIDTDILSAETHQIIRRKIGYVIQNGGLFPHLSAFENIALLPDHLGWSRDKTEQRARELCKMVKISFDKMRNKPAEFSGGQSQRISLIRALMTDPPYILLDEPLSSIDPLVRRELQIDLKEIFNELNKTVILVTHDLPEAVFLSDRIILLNEGEIEQEGSFSVMEKEPASTFVRKFIEAQRGINREKK